MSHAPEEQGALTLAEQALLDRTLRERRGAYLSFELAYLVPALLFVALGVVRSSTGAILAGFAMVLGFRVWALRHVARNEAVAHALLRKLCRRAGVPTSDAST